MCHKEEVPSLRHCDTAVDDRARLNVAITLFIGSLLARGVETIMVILANNYKDDLRLDSIFEDLCASALNRWYLLAQDDLVLAL